MWHGSTPMILQPIQLCYQVYAWVVAFSIAFGLSLFLLAVGRFCGFSGTEVTLTVICSIGYFLVRCMISTQLASDRSCDNTCFETTHDLAIQCFCLNEKEKLISHDSNCAICLDTLDGKERISLIRVCGHMFHEKCLESWTVRDNTTCPYCRQEIGRHSMNGDYSDSHKTGAWGDFDGIFDNVYG